MVRQRYPLPLVLVVILAAATVANGQPQNFYPLDVVGQIRSLNKRADALGFHIGSSPDPSMCYHYQGLARSNGPGRPYFFVTKSGNHPGGICPVLCSQGGVCTEVGDGPGNLLVARMGSRETSGERLRSNRLARGKETSDTVPPSSDAVVTTITFDGSNGWPWFGHAGGVQTIGDVLAVALEHPYDPVDVENNYNAIQFIDVSNPEAPTPLSTFRFVANSSTTAGVVAVTAQPNGRHLMMIAGKDNQAARIFESNGESLKSPTLGWTHVDTWRPADNPVNPPCWTLPPTSEIPYTVSWGWPDGGILDYAHQQLAFVREGGPDGPLYLIATRNDNAVPGPFGDDMIDVYRVSWDGTTFSLGCALQKEVETFASSDGSLIWETRNADFAAGGGIYVSPTGELLVYGAEHDNDGPADTVKMAEFRPRDMMRFGSPTHDPSLSPGGPYRVPEGGAVTVSGTPHLPATKAWVQLWVDRNWSSDERYLVIDYPDRAKDDFDNFKELDDAKFNPATTGFSDVASSVRWFAPTGCTIRLNDDDFGDDSFPGEHNVTLTGFGELRTLPDLSEISDDARDSHVDDRITSMQFFSDCDTYYSLSSLQVGWDLDGNGVYETTGQSFHFSAADLDGPAAAPVRGRVFHQVDGRVGHADTNVNVLNVAPMISAPALRDGAGRTLGASHYAIVGVPVTLSATFTDPGKPDTHFAFVEWGDGSYSPHSELDTFGPATGGGVGSIVERHSFSVAGQLTISVRVTDDDAAASIATAMLRVMTAREALQDVIDRLPLGSARDFLDGERNGAAANGAIDHLDGGRASAALSMILRALAVLNDPAIEATLVLVAQSVAIEAYAEAVAANTPANPGQSIKLGEIAALLQAGATHLAAGSWEPAVSAFADAARRAEGMS